MEFASYDEAHQFICSMTNYEVQDRFAPADLIFRLERVRDFLGRLGDPQEGWRSVHIGGTKGKGSTAHMVDSILRRQGVVTGLFTSPHVVDMRERIQREGKWIGEEDFARLVGAMGDAVQTMNEEDAGSKPTYFEMMTAVAFMYFAEFPVDVGVVEVGLGGRLDATNVLQPIASAITNVGLDHEDTLGYTIAEIAKEQGALTVGIVTKPFLFEGRPRMRTAEDGIAELKERVDTLIVIPNERLLSIASEDTALGDAFRMVDEVLLQATRGISDLISVPGVINLDFNDVKTVMLQGGDALMGVGGERGEDRAQQAAQQAIESPLLEDISIAGAKAVLVNISGANNMTLMDFRTAATTITEAAGEEANIILGTAVDEGLGDEIRVTVIATGFNGVEEIPKQRQEQDAPLKLARPPRGKERDVPTYMRQRKQVVIEDEDLSDVRLDDLEAPTFLRKKQMNGQ